MKIFTLKTKSEVLVLPETNTSSSVYLDLITWTRMQEGYEACIQYYWIETVVIDEEDTFVCHKIKSIGNISSVDFATANALAENIQPTGDNYVDKETSYLIGGTLAIIGEQGLWGLTSSDWEEN